MRCESCNKMVSYGEPEHEIQEESVDDDGNVSVEVRLVLPCAECGQELKENTFNLEYQLDHTCDKEVADGGDRFTLELDEPDNTEDYRPRFKEDKKGNKKPVPQRYQKHYFGVMIGGTITCNACGETFDFSMSDEAQASSFEEV